MPSLGPTRQNALLLISLLFGQLLLMAGSARDAGGVTYLELALMRLSRPFVGAAGSVAEAGRGALDDTRSLFETRRDNRRLQIENRLLRGQLARIEEQARENERLRRLLEMREAAMPESIGASVVHATLSERERLMIIDRGARDGVARDMGVVAWGGVVGRVVAAGPTLSKVRLLTDPASGVAGLVQRNRVQGIVVGNGAAPVAMRYVPTFADVMIGDRVVTSGLDGVFPKGYGIGSVSYVGKGSGISQVIELSSEVAFERLEEVLVLLGSPLEEQRRGNAGLGEAGP